ncbi:MAG: NAD(P)-dependent oxidoreductase [Rhodocyclaceae bacterium]|nr:NAD(P)-dependent oxidoreductase [Rhodocyclaceae bacterium]
MSDAVVPEFLVTGATGFVGSHLVRRLVAKGCRVRVMVRSPEKLDSELFGRCDVLVGDLTDRNALRAAVDGVRVIFHCAANVQTWDSFASYHAVNVAGVENLLQAIVAGCSSLSRLVHVSTVDVYGFPMLPCDERAVVSGQGFGYGESKLQGEHLARTFCREHNIPLTVLRPTNVIGPGSQFIMRIGEALQSGLMLMIDGGRANAGLLHVDNLIDYLVWAADAEVAVGQCYNVRDAYDVSWLEFLSIFRDRLDGRGVVLDLPFRVADFLGGLFEFSYRKLRLTGEPLLHCLLVRIFGRTCGHDARKIQTDSGMRGMVEFSEAMDNSVNWFISQQRNGHVINDGKNN